MSWIPSDLQYTEPEPYTPPTWADGTDEEIVEALEKHYAGEIDLTDYWSVGDERVVTLSEMSSLYPLKDTHIAQDVTLVLSEIGGKYLADGTTECLFQVDQKNCLQNYNTNTSMNNNNTNTGGWNLSARRSWCNNIYKNAIPSTLRPIFKQFTNVSSRGGNTSYMDTTIDYFALRAEIEIFGSLTYSVSGEGSQVAWYTDASNRAKTYSYWLRSARGKNTTMFIYKDGNANRSLTDNANTSKGIAPFGVI